LFNESFFLYEKSLKTRTIIKERKPKVRFHKRIITYSKKC